MSGIFADLLIWQRIVLVLAVAVAAHGLVRLLRLLSARAMLSAMVTRGTKVRTVVSLLTSTLVFVLYFSAVGFALNELGVSLKTYFASASIIGLAVAFGSQGFVQDVVSGLTIVFTDLFDIGDVIEIGGQVGVVEHFGIRYTTLRSPLGAEVFVPNRNILNVVTYPRGYIRCQVDIVLPASEDMADTIVAAAREQTATVQEQFPGILRAPPEITGPHRTRDSKSYLRIKFRIWPGRGSPLEGYFRQNLLQTAKAIDSTFADWMIAVNYEVDRYTRPAANRRQPIDHA